MPLVVKCQMWLSMLFERVIFRDLFLKSHSCSSVAALQVWLIDFHVMWFSELSIWELCKASNEPSSFIYLFCSHSVKCTVMSKLSKTDVIHKKEIEMMYYKKNSWVFISNPELFSYLRLKHVAVSVPLTQYRVFVKCLWLSLLNAKCDCRSAFSHHTFFFFFSVFRWNCWGVTEWWRKAIWVVQDSW